MEFLELRASTSSGYRDKVLINPEHIISVHPSRNSGSIIRTISEPRIEVLDSLDEINKRLIEIYRAHQARD